jgi:hypothetical protein
MLFLFRVRIRSRGVDSTLRKEWLGFGGRRWVFIAQLASMEFLRGVRDYSENVRTQMRKSAHCIGYNCYK